MARQAKLMKTNFTANDNITTIPNVLICSEWVSGNYSLILSNLLFTTLYHYNIIDFKIVDSLVIIIISFQCDLLI